MAEIDYLLGLGFTKEQAERLIAIKEKYLRGGYSWRPPEMA